VADDAQLAGRSTACERMLHRRWTGNDDEMDMLEYRPAGQLDHDADTAGVDRARAAEVEHDTARAARQDAPDRGPGRVADGWI
jgi:hypothetical protein